MRKAVRYPYVEMDAAVGSASALPFLTISLALADRIVTVPGLLDTGATINVMPFDVGVQLGAEWGKQRSKVKLTGNLADVEARVLVVEASIGKFAPVRLAFAWTKRVQFR